MKVDKKALAFIKDSFSDKLFSRYEQKTTKEIWVKLKSGFETVDAQLLFVFIINYCIVPRSEMNK